MEVKLTLIVVLLAAIAISVQARRENQERGGRVNGRERGESRFGGRPGSDGSQMAGVPGRGGGPRGGRRLDGPGFGGPLMEGSGENDGSEEGRRFDGPGFSAFRPGRPSFGGFGLFGLFGQGGRRDGGEVETDAAEPLGDGQGGSGRFDGPRRFGGRRHEGRGGHQHNDSSEEDGHGRRHGHRGRWHESESEEEEFTTESMTTSAAVPEVIEVDLNESDMNIIGEV